MKTEKIALLTGLLLFSSAILPGCWNYKEIDQLSVVAGVAIDRGINEKLSVTAEIVEISHGKGAKENPKTITMEGETIFDAVRRMISILGKKLYLSHAKVVIVSSEIAEDGILQVIDWFSRDAETRSDIRLLVSREQTAREILTSQSISETVISYEMDKVLRNQKGLHHAPNIEIWKFANNLQSKGISAVAASVGLKNTSGKKVPDIQGAAIFRGDKLLGFIDSLETMSMLFIQDEIKGGVLVVKEANSNVGSTEVSLEISSNKTKVKPFIRNGSVEIDISTKTIAAIDEITNTQNLITDGELKKLEACAEKMLKDRIEGIIKKAQTEYNADIFGFGDKLHKENPSAWNSVEQDWSKIFKDVKINVETEIHIKNSAMLTKPLEVG